MSRSLSANGMTARLIIAAGALILLCAGFPAAANFSYVQVSADLEDSYSAAWGDFDGDGDLDLLIGNLGQPNRVYENTAGSFAAVWSTTETDNTYEAAWGDFDGDGDLDFVAANSGAASRVYLKNNGVDSFAAPASVATADTRSVAVGDIDNDGDLDLVFGNYGVNTVYKNNGSASFSLAWTSALGNNTESVALADIDGDGDLDIIEGNNPNANYVYINDGTGANFTTWQTAETDNTMSVAAGDFDGDGDMDFAAGNSGQATRVYKNNGNNTFSVQWSSAETDNAYSVAWGDVDADGDLDILVGNNGQANRIYTWGGSTFALATSTAQTDSTTAIAWADYDNSGDMDFVAANLSSNVNRIYVNTDNPANSAPPTPSVTAEPDTPPGGITLQWAPPSDDHTPGSLLSYNVRIGTSPGGHNVAPGQFTGYPGNARAGFSTFTVTISTPGTYYWGVSAIDTTGFKLSAESAEDSFVVDSTAPSNIANVYDSLGSDTAYATSTTQLSANWTASTDAESGLEAYYYAIGTSAGTTDIVPWTSNGSGTSVTKSGLSLTNGVTYYFTVKARNNAGQESTPANSSGQKVDVTAPSSVSPVKDGTGADIDYTSSGTQLSANWSSSSDSQSGIQAYWYAIGTSPGDTDVVNWTSTSTTSVTHAGLSLTDGQTYYFTVRAENGAGLYQAVPSNSDGQTVDSSAPSAVATVNDGAGSDAAYTTSGSQLSANWTASTDAGSGIVAYYYAIGTAAGGTNVVGWTNNGLSTSVTKTGLTLTDGQTYFFTVKAENGAGLQATPANSNGQMADASPPADVAVSDGTGADVTYTTSNTQLSANWTASSDAHSGVAKYWYSIGTTIAGTNIVPWTDNGAGTSVTHASLSLANGGTYYVNVKAENNAGLQSNVATSNGQQVDITPPSAPATVNDGTGADITNQANLTQLSANWTASSDSETGIALYWYSIGTSAGASDTVSWTNNGASTSVTKTGLSLTDGQIYYFTIKAENPAGLQAATAGSNGVTVDTSMPTDVTTVNDGTASDVAYTTDNSQLSANWSDSTDTQSGLAKYWYSVGTSAGASDTVSWTDNGLATSTTKTGLALTDGVTYYFNIKAENNAALQSNPASSNGQMVDTSIPDAVAVSDGAGADADYTTTNTQLTANWTASADAHSGIKKYWYGIGSTQGGTEVVGWTDNALNSSVTHTGLLLPNGFTFYFTVKAENNAGLFSTITNSDGQFVDITAPANVATVNDGAGADIDYLTVDNSLSANWSDSSDGESGLARYWYSVYDQTAGDAVVVGWTDNALATSVTITPSLANGHTYYLKIKAENAAGLQSTPANSDGFMVDTTAPLDVGSVYDGAGADVDYATTTSVLYANWTATTDGESGVVKYYYGIGTLGVCNNVVNWTDNGASTSVARGGLTLTNGQSYNFCVKAENAAGLQSSPVSSDGLTADSTPPADIAAVSDGAGSDIAWFSSTTQITANWGASSDGETGVAKYWYSVGTAPGSMDVVGWTDNGNNTSVTRAGLALTNTQTYYFRVKAENAAGLQSNITTSNGQTVDTTPPSNVTSVSDGAGSDTAYTSTNLELSANWTASSDSQSGIAKYWYSIGTSAGATDIVGWTDNGNNTSVTRAGLALSNGVIFYFNVKSENVAGVQSVSVTSSNGQKVDTTAPEIVTVADGTGADITYTTTNAQLQAKWTASADSESGIKKYWYAVGTSAGATDVAAWTDNGANTSVTHAFGSSLVNGQTYYFSVRAENNAGLQAATVSSNGQMVDVTAPSNVSSVSDGTGADVDFTTDGARLSANWPATTDNESGVKKYWYAIGTTSGGTDVAGWTDNGANISVTHNFSSNLTDGQTYYISVKAENNAGLLSNPVSSDGQLVGTSAPESVSVNDGTGADIDFTTTNTQLSANWTEASPAGAAVAKYWYAVGTSAGGNNVAGWTDAALATSATVTGLSLTDGVTYYFSVKVENVVGFLSDAASSDGVRVDTTAPGAITAVSDGAGDDADITSSLNTLSANWTASAEPHTGIEYLYSIGTSTGAADTVGWTSATTTSVTVGGLSLSEGGRYYFSVKARNDAGLESAVASSDGIAVNSAPPLVAISSPAQGETISGSVTITGAATDASLTKWTLEYGTGSSPSAWREISSGTAGVANGAFVTWDTSKLSGGYTIRLSAEDSLEGGSETSVSVSVQNQVGITGAIPGGEWRLISFPALPSDADLLSLFGTSTYKIFRWDPTADEDPTISRYRSLSSFLAGYSFWIKSFSGDLNYSYEANVTNTTQNYTLAIKAGWNQIATPFSHDFPWGQIQVRDGSDTYDLDTAAGKGLVATAIYAYDNTTGSWSQKDGTYSLPVQSGIFAYAYKDVELIFNPGAGQSKGVARVVKPVHDYLVKISAAAPNSADTDNYFGTMNMANPDFDRYDALEPPPSPNSNYTYLYFPHYDWEGRAGRYATDLRAPDRNVGGIAAWDFNVATNEAGETVSLAWGESDMPTDLYLFTLINTGTGESVDMAARGSYSYTAPAGGASEAAFRIEVARREAQRVTRKHTLTPGWRLIAVPVEPEETNAAVQLGDDLAELNVFQFYDGRFYPAGEADIQAGFGYWVYVDESTEIDVEGFLPPETEPVELPLKRGWNAIGNPFETAIAWDDNIKLYCGGRNMNLGEAVDEGALSGDIYRYDGTDYARLGIGARLEPWSGYLVKLEKDCKLSLRK